MTTDTARYEEDWATRVEVLDPDQIARDYVHIYERDIAWYGRRAWHWDGATARAVIERDRDAIVSRCAHILRRGDLLHGAARYQPSPRQLRICPVDAYAVELYGLPLPPEQTLRLVQLREDVGALTGRRFDVIHQLEHQIDDVVRLWTGSGAESSLWEVHFSAAYALAALHAERIERILLEDCPDPWMHTVAGILARLLRRADVVSSSTSYESITVTRPRVPRYPLVSKAYYALFCKRPDFVDLVLAFPGFLIVPDAFQMGKLADAPAGDFDAALELLRPHLPAWTQPLALERLAHYARTMPAGVIIAGGAWRGAGDETTGMPVDYTAHVCMWPRRRFFDAHASHLALADAAPGTWPASSQEWLNRFPPPPPPPRLSAEPRALAPEDHDRIFRKAILPDHGLG